jgi:rubredoxin
MSEQSNTGQHTCGDCGLSFDSEEALGEHRLATNHPALEPEDKIECERCGFVLESREELRRHMEQMHSVRG